MVMFIHILKIPVLKVTRHITFVLLRVLKSAILNLCLGVVLMDGVPRTGNWI
jgi:hypothetical protein